MLARRHDHLRGEVGLRARPRHRARAAPRDPGGRRRPDLARRPRRPARVRRRRRVPRLRARRGAPRGGAARRGGRRLPRARRLRRRAGAPLPDRLPRRRPRPPPPRRPVHRAGRDPARDRARRALGRPPRGDRRRRASRALAASDVTGVLLPASALFLGRPMPPARALVDAGAAVALATDFNPGQRVLREPAARLLARRDAAEALARPRRSRACTVNAAHVLGRADRKGRLAPGYDADLVAPRRARLALPRLPPRPRPRRRGHRRGAAELP